ncbi:MAG: hypothetical protein OJF59_002833 [Cytophagales bacterium]|jgi:hypothetical protein|nr:MAG: hypothetical protein OJF59_000077 [Cytophagales bacterium]WHZ09078.1 MAG: hypothetical protein OJF59_002833 [Cytophagales bacterium]
MAYVNRFVPTDDLVSHLQPVVTGILDESLKSKYAGFLAVNAVTVYELAIKDIFKEFSNKKNSVFGFFIEKYFAQINGRIVLKDLKGQHIKSFGDKYLDKFEKKLKAREKVILRTLRKDVRSCYSNLIICRHKYVHAGTPTLSFNEVVENYDIGKEVIHSLHEAMQR